MGLKIGIEVRVVEIVDVIGDDGTIIIVQMIVSYYQSLFVGSYHRSLLTIAVVLRMIQSVGVKSGN